MKEELHLFILWKNALYKKDEILKDIRKKFEIVKMYNVTWSDKKYSENLSRFYGTKLPDGSKKEEHCGKGTFLLIVVLDKNPKYEKRITTAGEDVVNINMFDAKTKYREMTGGGHKVHATNSVKETDHDLTLLLGLNSNDYINKCYNKKNKNKINEEENIKSDLIGSDGFKSVDEMFYVLNNSTEYAILRNFENLPEEIYLNDHNDIDIICKSRENTAYILNAKKAQDVNYRSQYHVKVEGKTANFDLRYIGDNYYYEKMEEDILKNRVWNKKGFYTLNDEDYFYSLLYHALIQKLDFSDDYKNRLKNMNKDYTNEIADSLEKSSQMLEKWMLNRKYIAVKPVDGTVIYNYNMLEYLKPLVYRNDKEYYELKEENAKLNKRIKEIKDELNLVINSRTWKYTNFIRKINQILKR